MKFIDYAKIYIKSGDGGNGVIRWHREKFVPKGGPSGGNGGKGGNVVFKTDPHINTLLDFKYKNKYIAANGDPGSKNTSSGKAAKDLIIRVPCGTIIRDAGTEEIIADMTEPEIEFIAAYGGYGGRGNAEFATPTNQTPRFAEDGKPGTEKEVILELKIIADVGIVGFPNVGKSTLISVISSAKPKIADYPFTTLIPNLGIVYIGDYQNYTVADIPGLIDGASSGKGLGIQFLRHIERTKMLLFMLDSNSENPKNDYEILNKELNNYNQDLLNKKKIICFSKIDTISEENLRKLMKIKFGDKSVHVMAISSVTHQSVNELKNLMWKLINEE